MLEGKNLWTAIGFAFTLASALVKLVYWATAVEHRVALLEYEEKYAHTMPWEARPLAPPAEQQ